MPNPWSFGWTQLFTIIGFIITVVISICGFRTFEVWKKEKIEEKRIGVAIDTLSLVYESKFIFDYIRNEMTFSYEWSDMPEEFKVDGKDGNSCSYYAILKRIESQKDFFERSWKVKVLCMAIFGPDVERIFLLMHQSLREIQTSAEMLLKCREPNVRTDLNIETWNRFRADIWPAYHVYAKDGDRVGRKLAEFRSEMENLCRPVIDHKVGVPQKTTSWWLRLMK